MGSRKKTIKEKSKRKIFIQTYNQLSIDEKINYKYWMYWLGGLRITIQDMLKYQPTEFNNLNYLKHNADLGAEVLRLYKFFL